ARFRPAGPAATAVGRPYHRRVDRRKSAPGKSLRAPAATQDPHGQSPTDRFPLAASPEPVRAAQRDPGRPVPDAPGAAVVAATQGAALQGPQPLRRLVPFLALDARDPPGHLAGLAHRRRRLAD